MKRGTVNKRNAKLVAVWIPKDMHDQIEARVREEDTDTSKWIRKALRNQFSALGINVSSPRVVAVIGVAAALTLFALSARAPEHPSVMFVGGEMVDSYAPIAGAGDY